MLVQSQQWKYQNNVWNLFKVKRHQTEVIMTFYCVVIVDFEQISHIVLVYLLLTWTCNCRLGRNSFRLMVENFIYLILFISSVVTRVNINRFFRTSCCSALRIFQGNRTILGWIAQIYRDLCRFVFRVDSQQVNICLYIQVNAFWNTKEYIDEQNLVKNVFKVTRHINSEESKGLQLRCSTKDPQALF